MALMAIQIYQIGTNSEFVNVEVICSIKEADISKRYIRLKTQKLKHIPNTYSSIHEIFVS